ncbi:universal stress protein [Stieleria sp. JC731]|uniref:universal stress protein n=1 Tax=Pirellulaceae TaxID=2691357 RepID=UPI001E4F15F4|nr:universal stress protein [Stieleria sp. JC731]MCC9603845.1 universal stress protein [Stieleria sp. JC731]
MNCFSNILVYVGATDPQAALIRAFEIAKSNGANVTLMEVLKPVPPAVGLLSSAIDPAEVERLLRQDHEQKLRDLASQFANSSDDSASQSQVSVLVQFGDPAQKITRQVLRGKHDLVIKTADGTSVSGKLFGSISRSLLRLCPCPVWLLKPQVHGEFDQVLTAVDIDATDETHRDLNQQLMQLASTIARMDNATLHVASAWQMWMEQSLRRRAGDAEIDQAIEKQEQLVQKNLQQLIEHVDTEGIDVQTHVRRGNASSEMFAVAEQVEADLIVMGTVCRTGVAGFLIGNTAENLLSNVTCSILAIKPAGFHTPVTLEGEDESEADVLPMV